MAGIGLDVESTVSHFIWKGTLRGCSHRKVKWIA